MNLLSWFAGIWSKGNERPGEPVSRDDDVVLTAKLPVKVTPDTALTYSAYWRGLALVAGSIAGVPLHVFKRGKESERERVYDHPVGKLLAHPSPGVNGFDFVESMQNYALGRGNAYAVIFRNNIGKPIELIQADTSNVRVVVRDKVPYYQMFVNGTVYELGAQDVLHVRGFGTAYVGYPLLTFAAASLGLGISLRDYSMEFFNNGATPPVVLSHPQLLGDKAISNLRKSWRKLYTGLKNAHLPLILEEGMEAKQLGINAKESQLLEARAFQLKDVANYLGLPPHKLGDSSRTSYNSLEQEDQAFLSDCLNRWLKQWETEVTSKLFTTAEAGTYFCEFKREALVRVDFQTQTSSLVEQVNNGLICLDEARAALNMPPVPGGHGQKFRKPLNIGIVGEPDTDKSKRNAWNDFAGRVLEDARQRVVSRLSKQAARAAKKPDDYLDRVDSICGSENTSVCREIMQIACDMYEIDCTELVDSMLSCVRQCLLSASECKPEQLASSVDEVIRSFDAMAVKCIAENINVKE